MPWFPIIDRERCSSCQQCASFCIFGVYQIAPDGQVSVAHPDRCKNNCPACARICPEVAIIFPKLAEAPINGAEVTDEEGQRERLRVDVDRILGDDVYAALAKRQAMAAKRLLRQQALVQAETERDRCRKQALQIGSGP